MDLNSLEIREATFLDLDEVIAHDQRHMMEPGYNGSLSHPFLPDHPFDWEKRTIEKQATWNKEISEEGWSRSFILTDNKNVYGHINLKNLFFATLHRAQLGMGLEEIVRNQGFGKKLLQFSILWAKNQPELYWMDLSYFAHNLPAEKLYTSCGFQKLFTYEDRLRVGDVIIDDVYMALKLK